MRAILLIDFGSTCTKVTSIDADAPRILGCAYDFTTVQTDIYEGFLRALQKLEKQTGKIEYEKTLACSSAAGGLKMIACGLVPSLTAEAAKRAALGAGAKVTGMYAYQMTEDDAAQIEQKKPDIFLLTGGTDGGNTEAILHNARLLAAINQPFPVVIAGNRAAAKECSQILSASSHEALVTENVMPTFNQLNIEPAKQVIRSVFLRRIISAKGLSRVQALIGDILMPTPAAVLGALELLSKGPDDDGRTGIGELMAVDLGGATTDVYSIASGAPGGAATLLRGLPEPFAKRSVEGDIGMRWSARGVIEAAGMEAVAAQSGLTPEQIETQLLRIDADKSVLPDSPSMEKLDFALATLAISVGLRRHSGTITQVYTPVGPVFQQTGKDLTHVSRLLLTGGALIHSKRYHEMAEAAMQYPAPESLMPRHAKALLDKDYILSALGLLAQTDKNAAFILLKNAFGKDE